MVYKRSVVVKRALKVTSNVPGECVKVTRTIIGVPSSGDKDHDGDVDANDSWDSEPESAKHYGDRNPPAGCAAYFKGGSEGYGHRCVTLGDGNLGKGDKLRSTDMLPTAYKVGVTSTTTIAEIEQHMGLTYVGWSETMNGVMIPDDITNKPKKTSRGLHVDNAIKNLETAKKNAKTGSQREADVNAALKAAKKLPFIK